MGDRGAYTGGVRAGDVIGMRSGGGGGWGDPATRDPEQVLADVRDERITMAQALEIYRTAINNENGVHVLDIEQTGHARR